MILNTNDFLRSISQALDFIEMDLFGVATNHSKRIAIIAVRIGILLDLSDEELFDLISLALLHDNGASLKILHDGLRGTSNEKQNLLENKQEHCMIGEENITGFQFKTNPVNIILYHHEHYDGSGFFGKKGDEIPLFSRIISLADILDLEFDLKAVVNNTSLRESLCTYVRRYNGLFFAPTIVDKFLCLVDQDTFWNELTDENIDNSLIKYMPDFSSDYSYIEIRDMTKTFSKIIDAKSAFTQLHSSGLADKVEKMCKYYGFDEDTTTQLLIAADLHDLGKLGISNKILDKPGTLTKEEFDEIKKHPEVSKACLDGIKGFELIVKWIYQHHEKLNGSGYPKGQNCETLDFQSRLLVCLDIYQALTEDRPYRNALGHSSAMNILNDMANNNLIDRQIVIDVNKCNAP